MNCLILFSGKNQKSITNLSSAEFAQRVVKVKHEVVIISIIIFGGSFTLEVPFKIVADNILKKKNIIFQRK